MLAIKGNIGDSRNNVTYTFNQLRADLNLIHKELHTKEQHKINNRCSTSVRQYNQKLR